MASADQATSRSEGEQRLAAPSISLPKGGGAIRGIGEKFAANPVTGTGSRTVPLAAGGNIGLRTRDQFGGGQGVIGIGSAAEAPSGNPAQGGVLFVEDGALKCRGSQGTVTVIAPA
jgi:hypothetical protein